MTNRIRLKQFYLPIVWLGLIILQLTFPFKGWEILIIAFTLVILLCFWMVISYRHNVSIKRRMRYGWAHVGDTIEEQIIVENNSLFPLTWMEIHDSSTVPGREKAIGTSVNAGSTTVWKIKQKCLQRGLFTIGPTHIVTGDLFGIFELRIDNPASTQMLVMPPVLPLPNIEITGYGFSGEGRKRQKSYIKGIQVASVRDYNANDPLHDIHWPSTARKNKLVSKTYDSTQVNQQWVILDLDRSVDFGEGLHSSREMAIMLAASLLKQANDANIATGLIASSSEDLLWIYPQKGELHLRKSFTRLALVTGGNKPLQDLLQAFNDDVKSPSSAIIITPSLSPGWLSQLQMLHMRSIVPTVLLLSPLDDGLETAQYRNMLIDLGINCHQVTSAMLDTSQLEKDATNTWEWRITGTGRAILKKQPGDTRWKLIQ